MKNYYLLWASGPDHTGIVSSVTKQLFYLNCNLEESSMMRLGSEFAIFVIFTSEKTISDKNFSPLKSNLSVGVKKITSREAQFTPSGDAYILRAHGQDKPGLVYQVTSCLAKHRFNITDLSTHRTTTGKKPGYILLIEGELPSKISIKKLQGALLLLEKSLKIKISLEPIAAQVA